MAGRPEPSIPLRFDKKPWMAKGGNDYVNAQYFW